MYLNFCRELYEKTDTNFMSVRFGGADRWILLRLDAASCFPTCSRCYVT